MWLDFLEGLFGKSIFDFDFELNMQKFSSFISKIALGGTLAGLSLLGSSAYAASTGRHVLVATFGYMGGQPGFVMPKWSSASTDTVIIEFDSKSQCEYVQSELKASWRTDILNSACVALPASAKIAR